MAGSATVSWNKSSDTNVAGYKIYYGTTARTGNCAPGGYPHMRDVGNTASSTFTDLADGQTYYFSVTAYNKAKKESCFSAEVEKTILAATTSAASMSGNTSANQSSEGWFRSIIKGAWQSIISLFKWKKQ